MHLILVFEADVHIIEFLDKILIKMEVPEGRR